jgi:hypothetical protein
MSPIGTWCERFVPSVSLPSTIFGPVQPFGERKIIIGQRGRALNPLVRASRWMRRRSATTTSSVAARAACAGRACRRSHRQAGLWPPTLAAPPTGSPAPVLARSLHGARLQPEWLGRFACFGERAGFCRTRPPGRNKASCCETFNSNLLRNVGPALIRRLTVGD